MKIEEREGDIDTNAIWVRVGNRCSGSELADLMSGVFGDSITGVDRSLMRQRYISLYEKSCPFPEIADEGPVIAELLRADPAGTTAIEIWSVGGQPFTTYRDVRDWRCHKGDSIGEITVGGKPVPVYQVRKRLI